MQRTQPFSQALSFLGQQECRHPPLGVVGEGVDGQSSPNDSSSSPGAMWKSFEVPEKLKKGSRGIGPDRASEIVIGQILSFLES